MQFLILLVHNYGNFKTENMKDLKIHLQNYYLQDSILSCSRAMGKTAIAKNAPSVNMSNQGIAFKLTKRKT